MILHITLPEDWAAARRTGRYTASTRGASIDDVGFLHASDDAAQVGVVGAAIYPDRPDAFVCGLDEDELAGAGLRVRREPGDPSDPHSAEFPHVYPDEAVSGHIPCSMLTPVTDPRADARVHREDSAEAAALLDAGWSVRSRSWGARLHLDDDADLAPYRGHVAAAEARGIEVRRLTAVDLPALRALDEEAAPRFPHTDGSRHEPLPDDLEARLSTPEGLAVGAFEGGVLIGFTLTFRSPDRWEVDRTAVASEHENRGVAKAVKAATVLATHARGGREWGTGGAEVNAASLRMNAALGFRLEPAWLGLTPPMTWEVFARAPASSYLDDKVT